MDRIEREKTTVRQMITIYCRRHHRPQQEGLCDVCRTLLAYAHRRLEHCPKSNDKTSCRKCEIHCYSATYREQIRLVMRYAGPRMLLLHPLAAIRHLHAELR